MKNIVLNNIIRKIKKNTDYDSTKIQEIKYGLEALYIIFTRTIIFLLINIIIGNSLEFIFFYIAYAIIRSFSFGLHAKNSLSCFLVSSFAFIGIPMLSILITFDIVFKIILSTCFFIIFLLFSPADTPKRPLVNKIKREKLKRYSVITVIIYIIGIFTLNNVMSNILILILCYQSMLISPLLYKVLNINYNNYLNYRFK